MNAGTFARLRRRMLTDIGFRTRLRANFRRTLAEEGLAEQLSEEQRDELYLGLMLHDALRMPDSRTRRPSIPTMPVRGRRPDAFDTRPRKAAGGADAPIDLNEWRARRARVVAP